MWLARQCGFVKKIHNINKKTHIWLIFYSTEVAKTKTRSPDVTCHNVQLFPLYFRSLTSGFLLSLGVDAVQLHRVNSVITWQWSEVWVCGLSPDRAPTFPTHFLSPWELRTESDMQFSPSSGDFTFVSSTGAEGKLHDDDHSLVTFTRSSITLNAAVVHCSYLREREECDYRLI